MGVEMSPDNSTNRSALIQKIIGAAFDAAHGIQNMDEQNLMQILGEAVKSKLLTAEDSYTLREQFLNTSKFDELISSRVSQILEKRGLGHIQS